MEPLSLKIADIVIAVSCPRLSFLKRVEDFFSPFVCSEPSPIFLEVDLSPTVWNFSQPEKGEVNFVALSDGWKAVGQGFELSYDKTAGYRMAIPDDVRLFSRALRVLFSQLLSESNGLLIHGAALCNGKTGFIFMGQSGAGKTTVANLAFSSGWKVINDELCIVRRIGEEYRVYGTPFRGEFQGTVHPEGVPLAGHFRLVKAKAPLVQKLSRIQGALAVLQCVMNFSNEPGENRLLMNRVDALVGEQPVMNLEFGRNPDFLAVIEGCHV